MAAVPTVRQISWGRLLLQLPLMGLLFYGYYLLELEDFVLWGGATYLLLTLVLRRLLAGANYRGMQLVRQQRFAEALPFFERSVAFFTAHRWVDTYRFVTILSAAGMDYKEMDLCNIAFCYGQLGQGLRAKAAYERVLQEYPNNGLAHAALNLINSFLPISGPE